MHVCTRNLGISGKDFYRRKLCIYSLAIVCYYKFVFSVVYRILVLLLYIFTCDIVCVKALDLFMYHYFWKRMRNSRKRRRTRRLRVQEKTKLFLLSHCCSEIIDLIREARVGLAKSN